MVAIPPLNFLDRCIFNAMAAGTGIFTVASAVPGYQTPLQAGAMSGLPYGYAAQSSDLTQWEYGYGTYSSATLSRTVILNSLGTSSPINFTAPPQVLLTTLAESLRQIVPFATGNLTFFVATTGSDSNPGTLVQPFATIQHAINVSLSFNYQNQFYATIHVAAGVYNEFPTVSPYINAGFGPFGEALALLGDSITPTNVSIAGLDINTPAQIVVVDGFNFNASSGFFISAGQLDYGNLAFSGNFQCFQMNGVGIATVPLGNQTIDFSGTNTIQDFYTGFDASGNSIFFGLHFIFAAATAITGAFLDVTFGAVEFAGNTFTNFGGVTGFAISAFSYAAVSTDDGTAAAVPGASGSITDNSSVWHSNNTGGAGFGTFQIAGLPTTTNLPARTWGVFKDTSGGGVYVAYNDNGTIKKVALT